MLIANGNINTPADTNKHILINVLNMNINYNSCVEYYYKSE